MFTSGIFSLLFFLVMIAAGAHIIVAFLLVGFAVTVSILGFNPAINLLGQTMYHAIATPNFTVLPLFILMGAFAERAGFAKEAYDAVGVVTKKLPGSIGIATCFASAFFGALSGSSLASAAIFGRLALPEMERHNYEKSFSLGCIASAGTFASMIPPSGMLILLAILTDQSVGVLFMAGIIPGLLTATVYAISIIIRVVRKPSLAPGMEFEKHYSFSEKFKLIFNIWPVLLLILVVLGGIYTGVFTPTEAAAAGSFLTLIIGMQKGYLRKLSEIRDALKSSAKTTSMIFAIMVGALYFGRVLALTRLPSNLGEYIIQLSVPGIVVIISIFAIYFLLGMFIPPAGFFAITIPIFFPLVLALDYNPIWFCIASMKLSEIAAVSPPVGLNAFTLKGIAGKGTSIEEVFTGVGPFILCDIIVLVMLMIFPSISLFLPDLYLG